MQLIKSLGKKAGVSLNPATPVETLDVILDELDLVLVMSVNPGFGGQAFIPAALDKIRALRQRITGRGLTTELEVDGGIKIDNIRAVVAAGADVLVAGSAVFNTVDYAATILALRGERCQHDRMMLDRFRLASLLQAFPRQTIPPGALRAAAVLVPLFHRDDRDFLLFTKRTAHLEHHAGEISFPGGGFDAGRYRPEGHRPAGNRRRAGYCPGPNRAAGTPG